MKGYTTHHLNLPKEDSDLFRRMKDKTRSRSFAATLTAALRALEEKEAHRDRELRSP